MAKYTIDGTTYANASDVMDVFGANDYGYNEWDEIAASTPEETDEGNRMAFPELSDEDIEQLNRATREYAAWFVANN